MKGLVITGPTGAIGMALINKCIEDKIPVLAVCHKGSKRIGQIPDSEYVTVMEASLNEYGELVGAMDNGDKTYDTFIHLAWNGTFGNTRNDMPLQAQNIQYALDAVELAHRLGCSTFIGAGSQAEYGRVDRPLRPETAVFPENGYGIAKLAAGQMTRIRCSQLGIKHIWTRILSVYGPYDGEYTMVMGTLKRMLSGEETHFTAGEQIWDYLYSADAAKMLFKLAQSGEDGRIYLLGSSDARPLREYIEDMHRLTDCQARLGLGDVPYSDKQVMCLTVDKDCVVDIGGLTEFEDGIRQTVEYLKGLQPYEGGKER